MSADTEDPALWERTPPCPECGRPLLLGSASGWQCDSDAESCRGRDLRFSHMAILKSMLCRELMLVKAARAVVSDVDAMRNGAYQFGPFEDSTTDFDGPFDAERVTVEWVNLAYSVDKLRPLTIERNEGKNVNKTS